MCSGSTHINHIHHINNYNRTNMHNRLSPRSRWVPPFNLVIMLSIISLLMLSHPFTPHIPLALDVSDSSSFMTLVYGLPTGANSCYEPHRNAMSVGRNGTGFAQIIVKLSSTLTPVTSYQPDTKYSVTISRASPDGIGFRGFLLQSVSGTSATDSMPNIEPLGYFLSPRLTDSIYYQHGFPSGCANPLSAVTHTIDRSSKRPSPTADSFTWVSPSEGSGSVTFRLIMVVTAFEWYGTGSSPITFTLSEEPSIPIIPSLPTPPTLGVDTITNQPFTAATIATFKEYRRLDGFDANPADLPLTDATIFPNMEMVGRIGVQSPAPSALLANDPYTLDASTLRMANKSFTRTANLTVQYAPDGGSLRNSSLLTGLPLPAPRRISNVLFGSQPHPANSRQVSELHTFFGMFLIMDLMKNAGQDSGCPIFNPVPLDDPTFPPGGSIPFYRWAPLNKTQYPPPSTYSATKHYVSTNTPALDLDTLYGHVTESSTSTIGGSYNGRKLRRFVGGELAEEQYEIGPLQVAEQPLFRVSADPRFNEAPISHSISLIFLREHNYQCRRLNASHPEWLGDDETLFQEARRINIAQWQKIVTREYIATLVGHPLTPYNGYKSGTNPRLSLEAATVGWRYGHVELNDNLWRLDSSWSAISSSIPTSYAVFHPSWVYGAENGLEDILRGAIGQAQRHVTTRMVHNFRNMQAFGFAFHHVPQQDLVALDIQRGRDVGLATYCEARRAYGLSVPATFADITRDGQVLMQLMELYDHVEDIDLYVGALAEPALDGSNLGALLSAIVLDSLENVRDGDRFWYERSLTADELAEVYATNFSTILLRNTELGGGGSGTNSNPTNLPPNCFFTPAASSIQGGVPLVIDTTADDGYDHTVKLLTNYELSWTIDQDQAAIHMQLRVGAGGWIGIGWGPQPNTMKGGDIILSIVQNDGSFTVTDCTALDVGPPTPDVSLNGTNDVYDTSGVYDAVTGITTIRFSRALVTNDPLHDHPFVADGTPTHLMFAYHATSKALIYHGPIRNDKWYIDLFAAPEPKFTVQQDSMGLRTALMVIGSVLLVPPMLSLGWLVQHRNSPTVRHSSFLFLCIMSVGVLIANASIIVAGLSITKGTCMLKMWMSSLAFCMCYGAIQVKTWRLERIFTTKKLTVVSLPALPLVLALGFYFLIDVSILLPWQVMDPLVPSYVSLSVATERLLTCSNTNDLFLGLWLIPKALLLAWSVYLCLRVRNIEERFNETGGLAQSVYFTLVFFALSILLGFLLRTFPNAHAFVFAIAIGAPFNFTLATQLLPKLLETYNRSGEKRTAGGPIKRNTVNDPKARPMSTSALSGGTGSGSGSHSQGDGLNVSRLTPMTDPSPRAEGHAVFGRTNSTILKSPASSIINTGVQSSPRPSSMTRGGSQGRFTRNDHPPLSPQMTPSTEAPIADLSPLPTLDSPQSTPMVNPTQVVCQLLDNSLPVDALPVPIAAPPVIDISPAVVPVPSPSSPSSSSYLSPDHSTLSVINGKSRRIILVHLPRENAPTTNSTT